MRFRIEVDLRRGDFRRQVRIAQDARVLGVEGPSGCGKSSLLHAIAGLLRPAAGRIAIDGRCLFDAGAGIDVPAHARGIGYVFQDLRLFPHLSVHGNLLYGMRRDAQVRWRLDDVVALLGIAPLLARRIDGLSGGEAQRVAIGRALLSQPALLLLDEPLSALDRTRREELLPYLMRLRDEVAIPMIYVSHQQAELQRMADAMVDIGEDGD